MFHYKKNITITLIIAASFILYTRACVSDEEDDSEDDEKIPRCIHGIGSYFSLRDKSPLKCIKFAIINTRRQDLINKYAHKYYDWFDKKANPEKIQIPVDFCTNHVNDKFKNLSEEKKEEEKKKCYDIIHIFGTEKEKILENALYEHKCVDRGKNRLKNIYLHEKYTYGYTYLEHIAEVIELQNNVEIFDILSFCHKIQSEKISSSKYEESEDIALQDLHAKKRKVSSSSSKHN